MGVYIKNMKMPENCGKCPFLIEEDIDFEICRQCGAGKSGYIYEKDIDGFPLDCPLVKLPDKHGRLVDADAIVNSMNDMKVGGEVFVTAVEYVKLIMNDADTIIEAEGEE